MGGNALKTKPISRVSMEEYELICDFILKTIPGSYTIPQPEFKRDFGDIDILVTIEENPDLTKRMCQHFEIEEIDIVVHANILSFPFGLHLLSESQEKKYFQVDLICVDRAEIEFYLFYYSYGYMVLILDYFLRQINVRLTAKGLLFTVNSKIYGLVLQDINKSQHISHLDDQKMHITKNVKDICQFVGVSYDKYKQGFSNCEDVYQWINTSKWVYTSIEEGLLLRFPKEFVRRYVDYCSSEGCLTIPKMDGNCCEKEIRKVIVDLDLESFVRGIVEQRERSLARKQKFGGQVFLKLGTSEDKLKKTIFAFRSYIENENKVDIMDWVDKNDSDEVERVIISFLSTFTLS